MIKQVLDNNMCTGCGLCTHDSMSFDSLGYLRPLNEQINDDISRNCCPGIEVSHLNNHTSYDLAWGPIVASRRGFSTDKEVRNKASSGGAISSILMYLVDSGEVDGVIQVGVENNNPIINGTFVNTSYEEILECSGSRYSPSSPLSIIRDVLSDDKVYAIVAKPCDIAAMRKLKSLNSEYDKKFKYLISFFCAGVPSLNGTKEILNKFGISEDDLIDFRYRGEGWPGLTTAKTRQGLSHSMTYNESWGTILNKHLQARCKVCADGIGEAADIVCADAWDKSDGAGYPSFEEKEGQSLIISRTKLGEQILDSMLSKQLLEAKEFPIDDIASIQPFQKERKELTLSRLTALKLTGRKPTRFVGYQLLKLSRRQGVMNFRSFLGALKRSLSNRI